jgi:hypothetical protein
VLPSDPRAANSTAVLLREGTARRLLQNAGFTDVASRYFLLLPTAHAWARRCERAFARLPLGAQYAAWQAKTVQTFARGDPLAANCCASGRASKSGASSPSRSA